MLRTFPKRPVGPMSVQAPLVDSFGQEFYSDMNADGVISSTRESSLLSDPDEPMVLSDPDFDAAAGYVSDFMLHQLPRIEVNDKSDPPVEALESRSVLSGGKSTPNKCISKSQLEELGEDSDIDVASGGHLQKCSTCGERVLLREAAARCPFTPSEQLCSACRVGSASKKRKNQAVSRSNGSSSGLSSISSGVSPNCDDVISDEVPQLTGSIDNVNCTDPICTSISQHASVAVAEDDADPMYFKCESEWVPCNRHFRRKLDANNLASMDSERFYFESDHLALKGNADYQLLMRTLALLDAQKLQARKDLERLHETRAIALAEPTTFVEGLRNDPSKLEIPSAQHIVNVPVIDWEHYNSVLPSSKSSKSRHSRKSHQDSSLLYASSGQSRFGASMETFTAARGLQSLASNDRLPTLIDALEDAHNTLPGNGRQAISDRTKSIDRPWSSKEQSQLDDLLEKFPPEATESRRWKKIASALGNRTPRQVASRIQKHCGKLRRGSSSLPGNAPSSAHRKNISRRSTSSRNSHSVRSSCSGSPLEPNVFVTDHENDEEDDDTFQVDSALVPTSDIGGVNVSSRSHVEVDYSGAVGNSSEQQQQQQAARPSQSSHKTRRSFSSVEPSTGDSEMDIHMQHAGYQCDGCGQSPLSGIRWHCQDCPEHNSVDFCNDCVDHCSIESDIHLRTHHMKPIRPPPSSELIDQDYLLFQPM